MLRWIAKRLGCSSVGHEGVSQLFQQPSASVMERERRGLTVLAAPNDILDIGDGSVLEVAVRGVWDAKTFCGSEALVDLVRCGFTALKIITLPIRFIYSNRLQTC